MPLAEHQRGHVEELAHGRLGRVARQVNDGCHVHDRDTADHAARLSESGAFAQTVAIRPGIPAEARSGPRRAPRVKPLRRVFGASATAAGAVGYAASHGGLYRASHGWSVPGFVGTIQRLWVSVLPCVPSVDSPSVPSSRSAAPLGDLATNLRWSWHPETQDLFAAIDPEPGGRRPRPGQTLGASPQRPAAELAADRRFLRMLELAPPTSSSTSPVTAGTRRRRPREAHPRAIAYFSPEFGITAVLPQYSGGLGILAGDHLKAASDLGVPLIGVGLLYRHGYFRQSLSREGWQQEPYPVLDPDGLPLTLLREAGRQPRARSGSPCPATTSWTRRSGSPRSGGCRCCCSTPTSRTTRGRARGHRPALRRQHEHRLLQEMLLGIGGVRAVRAYCRLTGARGAGGVPHQRGPRRLPRPRADPRAHVRRRPRPGLRRRARGHPRRDRVHHAHPGAGRHRPLPARADRAALRRQSPVAGRPDRPHPRDSVPRTTRAATAACSTWR